MDDVYDGTDFRKFMCKMNIQDKHVPLIFMFYYDGLKVVNGLGAAHGIHELGCFYWALLNLTPHSRLIIDGYANGYAFWSGVDTHVDRSSKSQIA